MVKKLNYRYVASCTLTNMHASVHLVISKHVDIRRLPLFLALRALPSLMSVLEHLRLGEVGFCKPVLRLQHCLCLVNMGHDVFKGFDEVGQVEIERDVMNPRCEEQGKTGRPLFDVGR